MVCDNVLVVITFTTKIELFVKFSHTFVKMVLLVVCIDRIA